MPSTSRLGRPGNPAHPRRQFTANTSETYTASELGTDIYPGATTGKGSMRMTLPTGSMVTAVYLTADSKDQVLSFYKARFGSDASVFDSPTAPSSPSIRANRSPSSSPSQKGTSENEGKTQISIVHTITNKPS